MIPENKNNIKPAVCLGVDDEGLANYRVEHEGPEQALYTLLARKIAGMNPYRVVDGVECFFCGGLYDEEHKTDCVWMLARTINLLDGQAAIDGASRMGAKADGGVL